MARKLFWGSGSTYCWRVQIVLQEKKLPYESKMLSFSNKEHKGPEVLEYNPRGQLPTFVDGDTVVNDSAAACEYLEAAYPDVKLLPDDIKLKAQTLQLMYETTSFYAPAREAVMYHRSNGKDAVFGTPEWASKIEAMKRELAYFEEYTKGKSFLVGDSFTLADAFFYPHLAFIIRFGLDLSKAGYPALAAYASSIKVRPSVAETVPPHWAEDAGSSLFANF